MFDAVSASIRSIAQLRSPGHPLLAEELSLAPIDEPSAGPTESVEEPGSCCGWFDSSFELRQGLQVVELSAAAALVALYGLPVQSQLCA